MVEAQDDVEDIFASFSDLHGEREIIHTPGLVRFGPVAVTAAPKDGEAIHKMAEQFFSSGVALAEMVDLGSISFAGRTILEFGSGAGLPSLLSSTASKPPRSVLLTDYPDPSITDNLAANVARNLPTAMAGCQVSWRGFEWGADVAPLLATLDEPSTGFDLIFLADLLWLTSNLPDLLKSCSETLAKSADATVYIVAGDYTPQSSIDLFFNAAAKLGFQSGPLDISPTWNGRLIEGLVGPDEEADEASWREALGRRKRRTNGWWMRWDPNVVKLR